MQQQAIALPPLPCDLAAIPRAALAETIDRLISELDGRDGDADLEDDDPAEIDDEDRAAWMERVDQTEAPLPKAAVMALQNDEGAELDDDDGGLCDEDVPAFDPLSRAIANVWCTSPGAGCPINGDSEYDDGC